MTFTPNVGDRVRMTADMPNDPNPVKRDDEGTVTRVMNAGGPFEQYSVQWASGRRLFLLPEDPFEVIR